MNQGYELKKRASNSQQNIQLPLLNKPYRTILNQIQEKGVEKHKASLKNSRSAEKFMKANRFDNYNVEVDHNLHSDENSSLNNTNIISNINNHKVGMDNTLLSQRSNI